MLPLQIFVFCSSLPYLLIYLSSPFSLSPTEPLMLFPMLVPFNAYTPVLTRLCSVVLLFVLVFFIDYSLDFRVFVENHIFRVSLSAHVALFVHRRALKKILLVLHDHHTSITNCVCVIVFGHFLKIPSSQTCIFKGKCVNNFCMCCKKLKI